jgi:hypothetical protein
MQILHYANFVGEMKAMYVMEDKTIAVLLSFLMEMKAVLL